MKVAFITDKADFQLDLYTLCALSLAQKKTETKIAVFYTSLTDDKAIAECPSNLEFIQIENQNEGGNIFRRFSFLKGLKKQIHTFEPDVVFFQKDNFIRGNWKAIYLLNPYPKKINLTLQRTLRKAHKILAYISHHSSILRYISSEKIIRIDPLIVAQKNEIKESSSYRKKYMDEHDYFLLYADNTEKIILFLKGFSQFKQWQKSQIRLCLIIPETIRSETAKKLENYRYRDSVKLMEKTEHVEDAVAGAFGNFNWSEMHEVSRILLLMTASEKPLFLPDDSEWRNLYEQKADFFESTEKSIFSSMTQLYKETLPTRAQAEARALSFLQHDAHYTLNSIEKLLEP